MCRAEAPHLSKFSERFADQGLVVLAISADNYEKSEIQKFTEQLKLKQTVLIMGNDVAVKKFNLKRWPSNVYIDRQGNVIDHDFGYAKPSEIEAKIRTILGN